VLALWGVLDPLARLEYAKRTNFQRLVNSTHNYFKNEGEIEEGNPQMILDRGENVLLPPVLIIQGTGDGNIPYYIPAQFEDSYNAAGGSIEVEWFPELPHRFAKQPSEETDVALARMKDFIARQVVGFVNGAGG
jgi:acetyl esterase/lipase